MRLMLEIVPSCHHAIMPVCMIQIWNTHGTCLTQDSPLLVLNCPPGCRSNFKIKIELSQIFQPLQVFVSQNWQKTSEIIVVYLLPSCLIFPSEDCRTVM